MVIAYLVMEVENSIKNTAQTRRLCSYPPLPESNPHLVGSMNTPLLSLWHMPAAKLFTKQRQPPLDGRIHRNRTNIVVGSCAMATIKGLAFISDILTIMALDTERPTPKEHSATDTDWLLLLHVLRHA